MDVIEDYYLKKYEQLKVLADTNKCKTLLMRNVDTGQLVVKKIMHKAAFDIYKGLKEIKNKNLVRVYECFIQGDECVAIEDYVNGKRFDDYYQGNRLTLQEAVTRAEDLCNGLKAIHEKGIVHRDIQPKNIIISNEGTLKIIDFDISRKENHEKSKDTELLGTVGYAAPEQYGFFQTSNRSDIYSVGVVLKEFFENQGLLFNEYLEEIVNKCMEIDPKNRFSDVNELMVELSKVAEMDESHNESDKIMPKTLDTSPKKTETLSQPEVDLLKKTETSSKPEKKLLKKPEKGQKTGKNSTKNTPQKELPPITFKYLLDTIPGFRRRKIVPMIISTIVYVWLIYIYATVALDYKGMNIPRSILVTIVAEATVIIPYIYLTNIADIASRLPRKTFRSKRREICYRICMAIFLFLILALILGFLLPGEKPG